MKTLIARPPWTAACLAASLLAAAPAGAGPATLSGVGPTEQEARRHCADAAERLQVLAEDMEAFMRQCIADYLRSPPGDIGVDPEPGSSGY